MFAVSHLRQSCLEFDSRPVIPERIARTDYEIRDVLRSQSASLVYPAAMAPTAVLDQEEPVVGTSAGTSDHPSSARDRVPPSRTTGTTIRIDQADLPRPARAASRPTLLVGVWVSLLVLDPVEEDLRPKVFPHERDEGARP